MENIEKTKGKPWNIGTGIFKSQDEVVKNILKLFPKIEPIYKMRGPGPTQIKDQQLNYAKIRDLGWDYLTSWSEGLIKTIQWWKTILKSNNMGE